MSSQVNTGRTKRHRVGWIALGYNKHDDFWYSSEGVFASAALAIEDLTEGISSYDVDFAYSVKVPLSPLLAKWHGKKS